MRASLTPFPTMPPTTTIAGETLAVKKQRRTYMRLTQPPRKYDGPEARAIREFVVREVQPHCHHKRHAQRALRWLGDFKGWAVPFLYKSLTVINMIVLRSEM